MGSTGFNFCNITYLTILKSLNCKLFRLKKSKSKNQKPKACPATKILISFEISSYERFYAHTEIGVAFIRPPLLNEFIFDRFAALRTAAGFGF